MGACLSEMAKGHFLRDVRWGIHVYMYFGLIPHLFRDMGSSKIIKIRGVVRILLSHVPYEYFCPLLYNKFAPRALTKGIEYTRFI